MNNQHKRDEFWEDENMTIAKVIKIALLVVWSSLYVVSARAVMTVIGLPVVAIGLLFKDMELLSSKTFTYHPRRYWTKVTLPKLLWPWSNQRDGAMGDTRGNYWLGEKNGDLQHPEWMHYNTFLKMWYWLAVRNPCNNFSRFTDEMACNIHELAFLCIRDTDDEFVDGKSYAKQFVWAEDNKGRNYWGYYALHKLGNYDLYVRLGWKIEPRHMDGYAKGDYEKGWKIFTVRMRISKNDS